MQCPLQGVPPAMFGLSQACLWVLLLHQVSSEVFLDARSATQLLSRSRRANSPFEELWKGNMERECVEERCDREEAREIFENEEQTTEFWNKYEDGDACEARPCVNNGVCKDGLGRYTCFCTTGYQGYNCEIVIPELCENKNGGCEHFCEVVGGNVECACADGYFLGSDEKSCNTNETFRCGVVHSKDTRTVFHYERSNRTVNWTEAESELDWLLPPPRENMTWQHDADYLEDAVWEEPILAQVRGDTRIVGGEDCPPGECPWQALLMNEEHRGFCGGTILNEYLILTAAHCMNQSQSIYVVLGEFDLLVKEGNEAVHNVDTVLIHKHYRPKTYHNDISIVKLQTPITFSRYILPACLPQRQFAENVLMKQASGLVSGFGRLGETRQPSTVLQRLSMPYVERAACMDSSQFRISNHMFCAGYAAAGKDACYGDSGGPHVTRYRNTYFVTGVVSWGEGCARDEKYGIYTQVSKYIRWIRNGMRLLMPKAGKGDLKEGPQESAAGWRKRRWSGGAARHKTIHM